MSPYVFPVTDERIDDKGITLRDYFAGQALVGWLAVQLKIGWWRSSTSHQLWTRPQTLKLTASRLRSKVALIARSTATNYKRLRQSMVCWRILSAFSGGSRRSMRRCGSQLTQPSPRYFWTPSLQHRGVHHSLSLKRIKTWHF